MSISLLRTGAGSIVAPAVIRSLREAGARVIAADADADAVGFAFADAAVRIPPASSDALVGALLAACRDQHVDVLFPDVDEEFLPLARARAAFSNVGVRLLLSDVETIERCTDKLRFAEEMTRRGLPVPWTRRAEDLPNAPFPLFVKPRRGRGSAQAMPARDATALADALRHVPDAIVQPLLPGPEFSIDTLSSLDGRFLYASVRERLATRSGISTHGRTLSWPDIEALAGRVVEAMGIAGPACLQCLLDDTGRPQFTDCNPRLGGGVTLSVEAGAPILRDLVRLLRGESPGGKTGYRAGLVMLRGDDGEARFLDPLADVRAVTFDLDDTLYDRREHLHGALAAVAAAIAPRTGLGRDALAAGLKATWRRLGSDHPRVFDEWLAGLGLDTEHVPACVEAFHSFVPPSLTPREGVPEALRSIRAHGLACAIVTDGRSAVQQAKWRALALSDLVDEVVCCSTPKPDPQGLLEAARRLRVAPSAVLHVGDHPRYDVVMAHRAGALSARVLCGEFATRPPDPEASADLVCADVAAVAERLPGAAIR